MANVEVIIKTIDRSGNDLTKFNGKLMDLAKNFLASASAASLVYEGGRKLMQYFQDSEEAAAGAERVQAQLNQTIKSTGGIAGITSGQINLLAESLSRQTAIDDDAIKKADALLLTFTKIGKETFPAATAAILDMSTALGTDLQSTTIQVGKALNGTKNGITALQRSGVSFTDNQRKMIQALFDTGKTAEAQRLIIQELNKEFGGQATAAANTYTGAQNRLNVALENQKEIVGERLIQTHKTYNEWMAEGIEKSNDLQQAVLISGKTFEQFTGAAKHSGMSLEEYVAQTLKGAAAAIEATNATNDNTAALDKNNLSLEEQEELIKTLSDARRFQLSLIGQMQNAEDSYEENAKRLASDRAKLEQERAALIAQGWWEGSQKVKEYDESILENDAKVKENEAAHDRASKNIILGLMEQKFVADGNLTDDELNWLLEKGKAWGIYSDKVIEEARDAIAEADQITAAINRIPDAKTFIMNIQAVTSEDLGLVGGHAGGGPAAGLTWVGERGPELVNLPPGSYVHDSSASRNMANESDPETKQLLRQIASNRIDERRLARSIVSAMMQGGA